MILGNNEEDMLLSMVFTHFKDKALMAQVAKKHDKSTIDYLIKKARVLGRHDIAEFFAGPNVKEATREQ